MNTPSRRFEEALLELRAGASVSDDARCRKALVFVLAALGPETDDKMMPRKAHRAYSFRLIGDCVYYEIERHPGLANWLTHRITTRVVNLSNGTETVHADGFRRLTVDDLGRFAARAPRRGSARADAFKEGAVCAIAYQNEIMRDAGDCSLADVAIGWVAWIASTYSLSGPWRGRVAHMHRALVESHGGNDFGDVEAREIVEAASDLWDALPRRGARGRSVQNGDGNERQDPSTGRETSRPSA